MNIYNYLKKDHQKVASLMNKITQSNSAADRKQLFNIMSEELLLHAKTEELTFYKALEARGGKHLQEKAEHAEKEHDEVEKIIKNLRSLEPTDSKWLIEFGYLKHAVEHHVEEEEGTIFTKARKILSERQAEQLAMKMEALKESKGVPSRPGPRPAGSPSLHVAGNQ